MYKRKPSRSSTGEVRHMTSAHVERHYGQKLGRGRGRSTIQSVHGYGRRLEFLSFIVRLKMKWKGEERCL